MYRLRGFTLIEMIIVIVIIGVIAGMVAVFIAQPVQGYADTVRRAAMTDVADLALKRMALEIRTAVPNSIKVTTLPTTTAVEFIPARTGGRYCSDSESGCNVLSFSSAGDSFDVLGPKVSVLLNDEVVIYNTGQTELDAYAGLNRRKVTAACGASTHLAACASPLVLSATTAQDAASLTLDGSALTHSSPSRRFQLVPSRGPVMFKCDTASKTLRRYDNYGYDSDETTPASGVGNSLLATDISACQFSYAQVSSANGLLIMSLTLSNSGESITLLHQIHVDNMP